MNAMPYRLYIHMFRSEKVAKEVKMRMSRS